MAKAYVCDRGGCDTFQRASARNGWFTVRELGLDLVWDFCSADCLLLHYGQRSPVESMDNPWKTGG